MLDPIDAKYAGSRARVLSSLADLFHSDPNGIGCHSVHPNRNGHALVPFCFEKVRQELNRDLVPARRSLGAGGYDRNLRTIDRAGDVVPICAMETRARKGQIDRAGASGGQWNR